MSGIPVWHSTIVSVGTKVPTALEENCTTYSFIPRNLSEFVTTLTELNAIAPAANIGLSKPSAASGIPILL
jgi:hypothetical protein